MQKEIVILCSIPDQNDATSFYRAVGPLGHLRKNSSLNDRYMIADRVSWGMLAMCDMIFFQRPSTEGQLRAIEMAKDMGKPVWVDYDDDLLSVPTDNPTHVIYGQVQSQVTVMNILSAADVVSVSTEGLAKNWRARGIKANMVVIENAIDHDLLSWKSIVTRKRENIVAWRGSPSHHRDVLSISPSLIEIINQSENFKFEFMGDRLWFLTDRCNPEKIGFTLPMTVPTYFRHIERMAPKVVIAPLVDSIFNQAKSNIAWLEATFSGALCIAPKMPEWDHLGVLNYLPSNNNDFKEILDMAMHMSEENHDRYVKSSREVIQEKYDIFKQNKRREDLIISLL